MLASQDYNIELKKSLDSMFNQNGRRCVINLAHFYHNREGTDLARRFTAFSADLLCCLEFWMNLLNPK